MKPNVSDPALGKLNVAAALQEIGILLELRAVVTFKPARVEEILEVVAESPVAIEINGDPYRLDMEPRWIRDQNVA
jgi:hypothetical protein